MDLFNGFITEMGIRDIQLQNRLFTWTSKRPVPSFSRLDRVFVSPERSLAYPVITLEAQEVLVSDYTPLVLTCKGLQQQQKKKSRMELFWFNYGLPHCMVQQLWANQSVDQEGEITAFDQKVTVLKRALSLWQFEAFGDMEKQLDCCKKAVKFFDQIEEKRVLFAHEFKLRLKIKERAFELANNIESKWKQRSRCNWLAHRDRNSKFFHAFASSRHSRNLVSELEEDGLLLTDSSQILQAFVDSMENLLGTRQEVLPFNAVVLYPTNPCLQ